MIDMRKDWMVLPCCILALAAACAGAGEKTLHHADSLTGVALSMGQRNPDTRLEVNTDKRFVSEGAGSIHVSSVAPHDAAGTSYIGFRIPIAAMRLAESQALAFEAWSSHPESTKALYARGLNREGKIVAGWTSWANPVSPTARTFVLVPGRESGALAWESTRINAPGDEIVAVEFLAGCVAKGESFDLYVDQIRVAPAPEIPPENFVEHGVVAPVGMPTWGPSTIATVDAAGRRIIFTKLWTGNDASYLFIDAETGETEQVYPPARGWGAYRVLMTPDNVIYDTVGNQMVAIDVPTRKVRQLGEIPSGMALSFARADDGTVYAGIYPSATLVSYNPAKRVFTNHGALNQEAWPQYFSPLVVDESGWVYGGIGLQESQVVGFHPASGEKRAFIPREKRQRGTPDVYRGTNGRVYANAEGWGWHVLSGGSAAAIEKPPVGAGPHGMDLFPDGSRYTRINVPDRQIFIQDKGAKQPREVRFDYQSTGVNIYTIIAGPDGKIHGATGIPLRVWNFDPARGETWNRGLGGFGGHINQFARQGDKLYGAVYSDGALLEYDPLEPYDDAAMHASKNPRRVHYSAKARDLYGRPHAVLAHTDGRHILVGGAAARVLLGSGMLIYDIETEEGKILDRQELIADQNINAMVSLPDGDVLVGTSVREPTGGAPGTAKTALIYRFNLQTRAITARWPMQPATPAVRDMVVAGDGLVYGLVEPSRLFVFDPARNALVHDEALTGYGDASGYQAPRAMIAAPDGNLYALFRNAVVRIEPGTFRHAAIARPRATITSGIAILDNRLYFGCGPRLFSCALELPGESAK